MAATSMEQLVALCKRRGFIFQGSDIYGGLQGTYDYGPLGVELKNHLKAAWWRSNVYERDDIEGLDASILGHHAVYTHSGHVDTFSDPMVDCKACQSRFRADHLTDSACMHCGSTDLTEPRPFNLMFKTHVGPVQDEAATAYLRPETAQDIFINFKNVLDSTPHHLPFGIAQIGKAFRNEVTPRHFIFRVREFEQMEIEYFVKPGEDEACMQAWIKCRYDWWIDQGLDPAALKLEPQKPEELAHYSKATVDLLYQFPHGLEELEGIANRTDYDLGSHTKSQKDYALHAKVRPNEASTTKLALRDLGGDESFVPFVIEPSAGLDRGVLAVLTAAYHEEVLEEGRRRVVLKLKPHLAPIKVAVIPLAKNNQQIIEKSQKVMTQLRQLGIGRVVYEATGNIGKGYRRHDEIGTPLCVTIDFESLGQEDPALMDTVTVRQRDTMVQERMSVDDLIKYVTQLYR